MKKLHILFIGLLSLSTLYAQDINDALLFSQSEVQGTARFRALSGAFGALGGDISAVNINPAGSAVFNQSHASGTLSILSEDNNSQYFDGITNSNSNTVDLNQAGAVFVFKNSTNKPWRKLSLGVAYDKTNNFNNNWSAVGTNTFNNVIEIRDNSNVLIASSPDNSIASYFFDYANGYKFNGAQLQNDEAAFLGFKSYILNESTVDNSFYDSAIGPGNFAHDYLYAANGYNGKLSFNIAGQYQDKLYLGLNLNTHFIDYQRTHSLFEENNNPGSTVNYIEFENSLSTYGNGFSFQLGGIYKVTNALRLGLTYDSSTWFRINEELIQNLYTEADNGFEGSGNLESIEIPSEFSILIPSYRLQTPDKFTGSIAYIFGKQGLLSFDYSTRNYGNVTFRPVADTFFADQNTLMSETFTRAATYRIGGEYRFKELSFRGGFRYEESPYKNGITIGDLRGYSIGFGYNFGNTRLDITYDRWDRTDEIPIYQLIDTAKIDRSNSNVTISLCFNI